MSVVFSSQISEHFKVCLCVYMCGYVRKYCGAILDVCGLAACLDGGV